MTTRLKIDGMSCDHCVRRVTRALAAVPGVSVREVAVGRAEVEYDGEPATVAALLKAVEDAGYTGAVDA